MPGRYPPQIKYIIGNEGCERFSFYGMKNTLVMFMISATVGWGLPKEQAESNYHLFVSAAYFFPLIGGFIADRYLGKYKTILYLSLFYTVGHALLAMFEKVPMGFYAGLAIIAIGSGGIKPCVSAFVGDQFDESNKHQVKGVFALFYWIINFGSFFATLMIPKLLEWAGPSVAFGIPGVLMLAAVIVFWMGRKHYVNAAPIRENPHSFFKVLSDAIELRAQRKPGTHWLDPALARHPEEAVAGVKAVFRVLPIFLMIPIFWALFDQKGSTWVVQATRMDLQVGDWKLAPSQLMALNPLMVMLLVPFTNFVLYPGLERIGLALTPLRRMTLGMFVAGASFATIALLQVVIDRGQTISVLWQTGPYLLITLAEVLVSVTGLEFAYTQAPREMKSIIMSLWTLTVTVGNLLVAAISRLNVFEGAPQYFFYAGLICLAGVVFGLIARGYVPMDFFQKAGPQPVPAAGAAKPAA